MDPVTGLSLGRVAIGAAALASPAFSTKMFRLDGASNPQLVPSVTSAMRILLLAAIVVALPLATARGAERRCSGDIRTGA